MSARIPAAHVVAWSIIYIHESSSIEHVCSGEDKLKLTLTNFCNPCKMTQIPGLPGGIMTQIPGLPGGIMTQVSGLPGGIS